MWIRVNPSVGIWGYASRINPKFRLWFTFNDSKPQNVNVEKLPEDIRKAVQGALHTKTLIEVSVDGSVVKTPATPRPSLAPVAASRKPAAPSKPTSGTTGNPVVDENLRGLLKQGVTSIRREVSLMKDPMMISAAIAMEKSGKARKKVLEALDKQLTKFIGVRPVGRAKNDLNVYDNLLDVEEEDEIIYTPAGGDALVEKEPE